MELDLVCKRLQVLPGGQLEEIAAMWILHNPVALCRHLQEANLCEEVGYCLSSSPVALVGITVHLAVVVTPTCHGSAGWSTNNDQGFVSFHILDEGLSVCCL